MATTFNEATIAFETLTSGVRRQRLLTPSRVPGSNILLDRLTLATGASFALAVPAQSLAWFQMLSGTAKLIHDHDGQVLSESHVVFLPMNFHATLATDSRAELLYAEVPNALRFDPGLASHPPQFSVVDWTREPVLNSQHDARKRIYLATPKLCGTRAIKAEMIIYPSGTTAANHHHVGAEHFMYILRGRGTAYANERPFAVRTGDAVFYPDGERHYLSASGEEDLVFTEFFAPGECTTVWVDDSKVCTWLPSGRDIQGRTPVREIQGHNLAAFAIPKDV